jgi:hypothetical protein
MEVLNCYFSDALHSLNIFQVFVYVCKDFQDIENSLST